MATYDAILDSARQLNYAQRQMLADAMLETLHPPLTLSPDWDEILRRLEEVKSGKDPGVDPYEVLERLKKKFSA